jgi:hypothetical protein
MVVVNLLKILKEKFTSLRILIFRVLDYKSIDFLFKQSAVKKKMSGTLISDH